MSDISIRGRSFAARLDRWRRFGSALVLISACFGLFAYLFAQSEEHGISELPAATRQRIYQQSLDGFRSLCGPEAAPALADKCRQDAAFLREFPECDEACQQLIRQVPYQNQTR